MNTVSCSEGIGLLIVIIKKMMTIIQIVTPILLIIMLSIQITKMMKNPDEKKNLSKLRNSMIAAAIIFFIPMLVSIFIFLTGNGNVWKQCWNGNKNYSTSPNYIGTKEDAKSPIGKENDYQKGVPKHNKANLSYEGVSETQVKYAGDDRYRITFGDTTYEVFGQNESSFSQATLRDGRSFSTGGCGPTALMSALSAYGYKGNPVELNQAGSDVSVESHENAIKTLQKEGKIPKSVQVISHPKSSLPKTADIFYLELREALEKNHTVVIDLREAEKINNNFGDVFDNGGPHAHWVSLIGYDPSNDKTFVANTCGSRKWFELKRMTDSTFQAVSGQVFSDESLWVGSWIEIFE